MPPSEKTKDELIQRQLDRSIKIRGENRNTGPGTEARGYGFVLKEINNKRIFMYATLGRVDGGGKLVTPVAMMQSRANTRSTQHI